MMTRRRVFGALFFALALALSVGSVTMLASGDPVTVTIPSGDSVLAVCQVGQPSVATDTAGVILSCAVETGTPTPTATPGGEWWLAGGVDPADVVGAWKAKGAASYTASIDSLSGGPDLYAPVGVPTWTAALGWQGGQNNRLQVVGEAYPAYGWTYVMRVRNARTASQQFMGCRNIYGDRKTGMDLNNTGSYQELSGFRPIEVGGVVVTGTMMLAGGSYYTDGILRSPTAVPNPGAACTVPLMILTNNWGGQPHGGGFLTEVQGVAIYSDTLTAGQAAAIATAVGGW